MNLPVAFSKMKDGYRKKREANGNIIAGSAKKNITGKNGSRILAGRKDNLQNSLEKNKFSRKTRLKKMKCVEDKKYG